MQPKRIRNIVAMTGACLMLALMPITAAFAGGCGTVWAHKHYCQASATTRIQFAKGQTSATVVGRLDNFYDLDLYRARARRGQHMQVSVSDTSGSARVYVLKPNGVLLEGAPGGVEIAHLPVGGDYRIRIVESQMGEPWTGTYKLNVSITN